MEAAKSFVAKHTSRRGHSTEVEEIVRPAVTWEQVRPSRHEITTHAVDKEIHRHHYHTTVQPLSHTVTLPTKHTHNIIPIKHTVHQKDDAEATKLRVESDAAQFKNTSVTLPTTHSVKQMPMVVGIHYHHHVHETVQPVIYKETHMPEVVHTTMPIYETHHMKAEHHTMSSLPLTTMAEFEALKAAPRSMQKYDGPPRPYESTFHTTFDKLGFGSHRTTPNKLHNEKLALHTGGHRRCSSSRSSSLSSGSVSSVSDMEAPMTPRSLTRNSKNMGHFHTAPMKDVNADRPVRIVESGSPRMSNESTGSGRQGFMSRLTGRA